VQPLYNVSVELGHNACGIDEARFYCTFIHKSPDMHYDKHQLVNNTLPSHHVKHDDARVPPNRRRAEKQAVSRHTGWLDLSLKRVLSVEFVVLSP
jgi:hypothetical protein